MKFGILLLCLAAWAGQARASDEPVPHHENNPHPGVIPQPLLWGRDNIRIQLPNGFPLCGVVESYSNSEVFYVPIDPTASCEAFWDDWDKWDFVVIDPYLDVPMNTATLDDYIHKWQPFFCAGIRWSEKSPSSDAPTVRAPAGRRLLGLETVTCTRIDKKSDRYSKAFVAYKPDPINLEGRGYTVGAYVHLKNRKAADRLLEHVVKLLKPLD